MRYRKPPRQHSLGKNRRREAKDVFVKQLLVTIVIILFVILVKKMDIAIVNKELNTLEAFLREDMHTEEISKFASMGFKKIKNVPDAAVAAFKEGDQKLAFSPPIDEKINKEKDEFMIHSIGGGTAVSVSENEKLGKYIKISHEGGLESIYGSLKDTQIKELSKVKKGQIIGSIANDKGEALYFALLLNGKVVDPNEYIDF